METTKKGSLRSKIFSRTLNNLPISYNLYVLCREYKKRYELMGASDMRTNGEFNLIKTVLPKCSTVFDVGANIGGWTELAFQINPHTSIHCFEPGKKTFQKLIENKFPTNVTCTNIGLSSKSGQQIFYLFGETSSGNSLYKREGIPLSQTATEVVDLETIEKYCTTNHIDTIDFMKIDVEGHELEVFKGGLSLFEKNKVQLIQFEYGGCQIDSRIFLKDIFSFFAPFDYSFYKLFPTYVKHIPKYDQEFENFQYQNWLIASNKTDLLKLLIQRW